MLQLVCCSLSGSLSTTTVASHECSLSMSAVAAMTARLPITTFWALYVLGK